MKFHKGEATLFCNRKIGAGYNICTLLFPLTVVCNICWHAECWKFMECMTLCCFDVLLYWLAPSVKNLWHKYKKNIWKICDISITIDFFHSCQENMSLVPRNYLICYFHECECVCVCAWGIFMCDKPATHGMWLHAVGCVCSSLSYWCDADSSFHESKINMNFKIPT